MTNYVFGALLLHSAGKPVDEANLKKVVSAVGDADEAKIKALVSALEGVNIEEAISKAAMPVAAAAPMASSQAVEKKEEKTEEDTAKKAEEAAEGLGALFG
ncbi:MAG: 50S ribosomal protein P1 [Candidatus Aenigmarchaeota archaeon]|nr:50S ribosomal protein P1 [Candidatus Aenigmarchaeota archaeon]